jgi:hypothetical protein
VQSSEVAFDDLLQGNTPRHPLRPCLAIGVIGGHANSPVRACEHNHLPIAVAELAPSVASGGAAHHRVLPTVLGYQVVTHSITRSMSSIVNSELHLRLF